MAPTRIMIIRHGEKPDDGADPPISAMAKGDTGGDNLSPRGWQRAGALVRFFAPRGDHDARPDALFAATADAGFTSLRTQQTLAPLADFLGVPVALPAPPTGVEAAASAVLATAGIALVAWEHRNIAKLVSAITGDDTLAPHWSSSRFDVMLVLERRKKSWDLTQVPQMLLAGDTKKPLRARRPEEDR